jgi:hypothetical protein
MIAKFQKGSAKAPQPACPTEKQRCMTLSTEAAEKAIFQDFQLIAFFQLCPSFFAPHRKSTSIHAHEGGC